GGGGGGGGGATSRSGSQTWWPTSAPRPAPTIVLPMMAPARSPSDGLPVLFSATPLAMPPAVPPMTAPPMAHAPHSRSVIDAQPESVRTTASPPARTSSLRMVPLLRSRPVLGAATANDGCGNRKGPGSQGARRFPARYDDERKLDTMEAHQFNRAPREVGTC